MGLTIPAYKLRQEISFEPTGKNTTGPRRSFYRGIRGDGSLHSSSRRTPQRRKLFGFFWVFDLQNQ